MALYSKGEFYVINPEPVKVCDFETYKKLKDLYDCVVKALDVEPNTHHITKYLNGDVILSWDDKEPKIKIVFKRDDENENN